MNKISKYFKLEENNTSVKQELIGGLTTFFAMVYILMVNANMFANPFSTGANPLGVSYETVYIATALSAVVGTIIMGLAAKIPFAQAPGMGLNAFFVYTLCIEFGFTYANALAIVLIDGLIFIVLSITGLRRMFFLSIPKQVRDAISPGIGLFIALIGLENSGIITCSTSTGVTIASFNILKDGSWASVMPMIVTLIGFFTIVILAKKNFKGSVIIGILVGMGLYYLLGLTVDGFYSNLNITLENPFTSIAKFADEGLFRVFKEGFDFSSYASANGVGKLILAIASSALALSFIDMFDTIGTLYGACERGGILTPDGDVPNMNKAMMSDAVATTVGAICGTSTVTTFSESAAGVIAGGKTGLTSLFTALFFLLAMFLTPIAKLIPSCATAPALIYVGVLMLGSVKKINFDKLEESVPAFLTIAMMPFAYNISYGIAFGLLSYIVISLFTGKIKEVKLGTYIISILFILMILFTH